MIQSTATALGKVIYVFICLSVYIVPSQNTLANAQRRALCVDWLICGVVDVLPFIQRTYYPHGHPADSGLTTGRI